MIQSFESQKFRAKSLKKHLDAHVRLKKKRMVGGMTMEVSAL